MSSTATDLVSASVNNWPDVSPSSVVERGAVKFRGKRGKSEKEGAKCGAYMTLLTS